MNPVVGRCPICQEALEVTRLYCRVCDTAIEGHFSLGRLCRLSPEQLQFVETFIRCEGKLNHVQEEMQLSYPAVRSRLNDVIRTLGYDVPEEAGPSSEQRRSILQDLAAGKLTSEEALRLLGSAA
ncbi:MAG TPA: DUF2089 domain-containing protein [Anaerolineae bacterium]|nr:DUF2089 domain-containing protein [Anaerolineae bacterium]HOQ98277.1 DUF2089 domain-containing protein [Anaerolineae bacterium]HPL27618.1 DUF2089 domain-containing protein [Anaerolineae bacterium]